MNTRKLIVALTLILVASLGFNAVYAQDGEPGGEGNRRNRINIIEELIAIVSEETGLRPVEIAMQLRYGSTLAEIITASGGDVDAVIAAAVEILTARIEEAVANGVLTREEADRILSNLEQRVTDAINGELPQQGAVRNRIQQVGRIIIEAVVEATGLDSQEIIQQVRDGATLAEIITANGGDVDAVIDAAIADATELINQAVADGQITQEQADTMIVELEDLFTRIINDELSFNGERGNLLRRGLLRLAAEMTGLSEEEIRTQLQSGMSLADVLTANNVDVNAFIDEAVARAETQLAEAVENGRLTQEEADARLTELRSQLETGIYEVFSPQATTTP